jgi:nucleoid-associated protein YgaU
VADDASSGAPANGLTRTGGTVTATLVTTPSGSRVGSPRPEPGSSPASQGRVHVVAGGDTLSKISQQYYGTPTRWGDILAANRDILGENNNLVIGRTLRIP